LSIPKKEENMKYFSRLSGNQSVLKMEVSGIEISKKLLKQMKEKNYLMIIT